MTVGTMTSQSVFLLPEGEVSFIALNKSRQRPTKPRKEVGRAYLLCIFEKGVLLFCSVVRQIYITFVYNYVLLL